MGETFAGLPMDVGVDLSERIRALVPEGMSMAQFALRWILDFDSVGVVIPGASRARQVVDNATACELPGLSQELHQELGRFYENHVVQHIRGPY